MANRIFIELTALIPKPENLEFERLGINSEGPTGYEDRMESPIMFNVDQIIAIHPDEEGPEFATLWTEEGYFVVQMGYWDLKDKLSQIIDIKLWD